MHQIPLRLILHSILHWGSSHSLQRCPKSFRWNLGTILLREVREQKKRRKGAGRNEKKGRESKPPIYISGYATVNGRPTTSIVLQTSPDGRRTSGGKESARRPMFLSASPHRSLSLCYNELYHVAARICRWYRTRRKSIRCQPIHLSLSRLGSSFTLRRTNDWRSLRHLDTYRLIESTFCNFYSISSRLPPALSELTIV